MKRPARSVHPSTEALERFALGLLESAAMDEVESHLGGCEACGLVVLGVPDDNLMRALRRRLGDVSRATRSCPAPSEEPS